MIRDPLNKIRKLQRKAQDKLVEQNPKACLSLLGKAFDLIEKRNLAPSIDSGLASWLCTIFDQACELSGQRREPTQHADVLRKLRCGNSSPYFPANETKSSAESARIKTTDAEFPATGTDLKGKALHSAKTTATPLAIIALHAESDQIENKTDWGDISLEGFDAPPSPAESAEARQIDVILKQKSLSLEQANRCVDALEQRLPIKEKRAAMHLRQALRISRAQSKSQIEARLPILRRLNDCRPDLGVGAYYLGRHFHLNRKYEKACEFYGLVQGYTSEQPAFLFRWAEAMLSRGSDDRTLHEGLEILNRAVKTDPNFPAAHLEIGRIYNTLYHRCISDSKNTRSMPRCSP